MPPPGHRPAVYLARALILLPVWGVGKLLQGTASLVTGLVLLTLVWGAAAFLLWELGALVRSLL
jgi:hypothetical protein